MVTSLVTSENTPLKYKLWVHRVIFPHILKIDLERFSKFITHVDILGTCLRPTPSHWEVWYMP